MIVNRNTTVYTDSQRSNTLLYVTAAFLYWMALYLYVPTLPTYVESKSENLALVGLVLSMYGLWQTIIRLPLGIAADWLGWRKPFIVVGFVLTGLGAWIMGMATSVEGLIIGRAITGLAAGTWVPLLVAFSSLFPPLEAVQASTVLTLACSSGCMLASVATGSLNDLGGYSLAFFLAAGTAALALLTVLPTRERRRQPQRPTVSSIGSLITRQSVMLPSLLNVVLHYAVYATSFGFLPILTKQLGATDVTQSMLMSVYLCMSTLGTLAAAATARRGRARHVVYLSFMLLLTGIGGMALAPSMPLLFVSQCCIGLSFGTGYSVLMGLSIQHVADTERTTAMGLHQAVCGIGMFSGSWLSGLLADAVGIRLMFGATAFACLTVALFVLRRFALLEQSNRGR